MASVYLTKEELNFIVNVVDVDIDEEENLVFANIWKKASDKLEYIECSKEMKKINELQEQLDNMKRAIKNKSRGWGIK